MKIPAVELRPTDLVKMDGLVYQVVERLGIRAAARRGQPIRLTLLRCDYSAGGPRRVEDVRGNVLLDVIR